MKSKRHDPKLNNLIDMDRQDSLCPRCMKAGDCLLMIHLKFYESEVQVKTCERYVEQRYKSIAFTFDGH